jgi:uncharacterized protein (DUF2062 family)
MMFRRRERLPLLTRIREHIWPRTGYRRSWRYIIHRALRIDDTSYRIAAGFACGVGMSFTPFIGFHFVLAALAAWLIGGNIIASVFGTLIGNPWMLPFLLWCSYSVGHWLLGGAAVKNLPDDITFRYLLHHPMRTFFPMAVGSIPNALIAWFVTFWPARILVARYQRLRRQRRAESASRNRRHAARAEIPR